jgi:hypothetical protein
LEGFKKMYQKQSKEVVADAGYGSEENYEILENKDITAYLNYNYFHKEQKKKMMSNPFLAQNLFYNIEQVFYICPMGQRMENLGKGKRISANRYESQIIYYQAKNCQGCPLRALCHQAKGNRTIEVNRRLNQLKAKAKELLTSQKGLEYRSKRPIEVEAVFGQLKNNNKFNRCTFKSIEKVEMEFLLMAIGHNFRKMMAKNNNASRARVKASMKVLNRVIKVKIYFLNTVTEYFFINQLTLNQFLKFVA